MAFSVGPVEGEADGIPDDASAAGLSGFPVGCSQAGLRSAESIGCHHEKLCRGFMVKA